MGGSKKDFITHILKHGSVKVVTVVFDREQGGREFLMKEFGIPLVSLVGMREHLKIGLKENFLVREEYDMIMAYLEDPKKWSDERKTAMS